MTDYSLIAAAFTRAAERDFRGSPLYKDLAQRIAEDPDLLAIAGRSNAGQFPPYLLLTAIHAMLLAQPVDPLAAFYPSLGGTAQGDPYPDFRTFVLRHETSLTAMIANAHVNKSIVRRAASLRPLIVEAARGAGWAAFHLVDLGCGAGFNLLLDHWRIDYDGGQSVGPADSSVIISTEIHAGAPPLEPLPRILSRTGLDLDPVDQMDPAMERWIIASVFPDDVVNLQLVRSALPILRQNSPRFVIGDATHTLGAVLAALPSGEPAIVMHSFALVQLRPDQRQNIVQTIRVEARNRSVARIGMEISGQNATLTLAAGHGREPQVLGEADIDGAWLSWKGTALA